MIRSLPAISHDITPSAFVGTVLATQSCQVGLHPAGIELSSCGAVPADREQAFGVLNDVAVVKVSKKDAAPRNLPAGSRRPPQCAEMSTRWDS